MTEKNSKRFPIEHHGELGADGPTGVLYASLPMELARDGELTPAARSVALYVWSHVENWQTSAKVIAEDLDMHRTTVARALDSLQARGWLVRQPYGRSGLKQSHEVWHIRLSNVRFTPEEVERLSATVYLPDPEGVSEKPTPSDVPCQKNRHPHVEKTDTPRAEKTDTKVVDSSSSGFTRSESTLVVQRQEEISRTDPGSVQQRRDEEEPTAEPGGSSYSFVDYDPFSSNPVEATPAEPELSNYELPPSLNLSEVEPERNPDGSTVITWVEVSRQDEPTGSDFDPFGQSPSPETVAERKAFVLNYCQGYSVEETAARLTVHYEGFNYSDCRADFRSALESGYLSKVIQRATV